MQVIGAGVLGLVLAGEDRPSTISTRCHVVRKPWPGTDSYLQGPMLGSAALKTVTFLSLFCSVVPSPKGRCFVPCRHFIWKQGASTSLGWRQQDQSDRLIVICILWLPFEFLARSACRTDASITHLLHSVDKAGRSCFLKSSMILVSHDTIWHPLSLNE